MLLPAIGFILACIIFTVLALIILRLVPSLHLSGTNIVLFVIGAFLGALVCNDLYGRLFAGSNEQLTGWSIPGYFAAMLLGAVCGGFLLVWLKARFLRPKPSGAGPKDVLIKGVRILKPLLPSKGFRFRFGGEGNGSGGVFAWGEFVRKDRRLELHFRCSLGLVRYHVGQDSASHEFYMRELDVWDRCQYPGFSDNPMDAFAGLAHDLGFAGDFLDGPATVLRQAAAKEAAITAARQADLMTGYVGDKGKIDQLRQSFRGKQYSEVVKLAGELKYPNRISESERKMVEIAQKRMKLPQNS